MVEIHSFEMHYVFQIVAESTRLVILFKNIYTLWGIYFIMEYQNTPYPTSHED